MDVVSVLVSAGLVMVVSFLLYMYGISSYGVFKKARIHGPTPLPFLGNLLPMVKRGFAYPLVEWKKRYGKVYGVYFGHKPVLVVSDLEMLKQIQVKDFYNFQNRWDIELYPNPIDKGLFFEKGERWRRIRNLIAPAFSACKLKLMCKQMHICAEKMAGRMERLAVRGDQTEVKSYLEAFTMDVIMLTSFGVHVDSQDNPDDPLIKNARNILKNNMYSKPFVFLCSLFPSFLTLGKKLDLCAWPKEAVDYVVQLVRNITQDRKQQPQTKDQDFLQLLLDAEGSDGNEDSMPDINANKDSGKTRLTEDEVIGQAFLFLLAGYETTASALQYLTYALATNPHVQDALYDEISSVLGEDEPSYESIIQMRYLEQVINESLRMFPIVPIITREARDTITIKGYRIEKGTAIGIPIYILHHDPDNFPNPEVFDPSRFSPENKKKINPIAFHPFGYGPRICIGMRLAQMEVKCALVHLLRKVRLVQCKDTQVPLTFDNNKIMQPSVPIQLILEPRKAS